MAPRLQIRFRLLAVTALALLAPLPVSALLALQRPQPALTTAQQLGAAPSCYTAPLAALGPLLLTAVLFLGPLVELALRVPAGLPPLQVVGLPVLQLLRALVAAPLLEEWVFRACAAPLWRAAGAGHGLTLFASCASFGVVHAHHFWELRRSGAEFAHACKAVAVQVAYTALFAAIAAHTFQRSGSFLGTAAAHALANAIGLPSLGWLSRGHPLHWARGAIAAGYALGIAAFAWLLGPGGSVLWAGAPCALFPTG